MYETILLPIDGSDATRRAIEEAIDLARDQAATLHALYVVDTTTATALPEAETVTVHDFMEQAGQAALEEVADRADEAGVPIERRVEYGPVSEAIVRYADDEAVDLIVMGTHGRSGIDRLLLGSVTERVIKRASQPVLVVEVEG